MLHILIAVDGSDHAHRAIEAVGKMARSSIELAASLLCVSPVPLFFGEYSVRTLQEIDDDQKKQQTSVLTKASEIAQAQGLSLREPVRAYGLVASEIVSVAKQLQVDQIAMGTRGMGAVGNLLLGSVAQRVIHDAPMPVLLVK